MYIWIDVVNGFGTIRPSVLLPRFIFFFCEFGSQSDFKEKLAAPQMSDVYVAFEAAAAAATTTTSTARNGEI